MRAAVYKGEQVLQVEDVPDPVAGSCACRRRRGPASRRSANLNVCSFIFRLLLAREEGECRRITVPYIFKYLPYLVDPYKCFAPLID